MILTSLSHLTPFLWPLALSDTARSAAPITATINANEATPNIQPLQPSEVREEPRRERAGSYAIQPRLRLKPGLSRMPVRMCRQ